MPLQYLLLITFKLFAYQSSNEEIINKSEKLISKICKQLNFDKYIFQMLFV